jgi:RHS repeat-associated protein
VGWAEGARDALAIAWPDGTTERIEHDSGLPARLSSPGSPDLQFVRRDPAPRRGDGPGTDQATRGAAHVELRRDARGAPAGLVRLDPATGTLRVEPPHDDDAPAMQAIAHRHGRATAIRLADGSVFRRGFDDFGRVAWIDEPDSPRRWARYDEADRLVEHRPGDGSVLRHRRDAAGRLIETSVESSGGSRVLGRYRWDGARLVESSNDAVTISWSRDAQGRLTGAEHRFAWRPDAPLRWEWRYDAHDRVIAETLPGGWVVRYRYAGDERVRIDVEGPQASASIDPARLRTALAVGDAVGPAAGDPDARFVAGRLDVAGGMRHLPDPHGRRAARAPLADGAPLGFVHDDWRLRAEVAGDAIRHWIWDGARPVALVDGGRVLRVVTDERLAPVRALDAEDRVVWQATYDRDGAASVHPGSSIDIALRLPGQYRDDPTGWHHNHWRTYDPGRGRYLERDPLGLQAGFADRDALFAYAGGDPVGHGDPWGLARLTWYAIGRDERGAALGTTRGWDNARWSFLIEDILPVTPEGAGRARPLATPFDGLLFDPWGDFVGRSELARGVVGNGLDAIGFVGTGGRELFAAFAAHYGGALVAPERFVVDGFDDRRASALATILAARALSARCVRLARAAVAASAAARHGAEPQARRRRAERGPCPTARLPGPHDPARPYRDDVERMRVERLQAAAEMQESPGGAIRVDCAPIAGCRSGQAVRIGDRTYHASYGRTQFTLTTFMPELMRLTARAGGDDAAALRAAVGLDAPIELDGRAATVADALALARAGSMPPTVRSTHCAASSAAHWRRRGPRSAGRAAGRAPHGAAPRHGPAPRGVRGHAVLPAPERDGGLTVEEARHAIAASAAGTVRYLRPGLGGPQGFDRWLIDLFSSATRTTTSPARSCATTCDGSSTRRTWRRRSPTPTRRAPRPGSSGRRGSRPTWPSASRSSTTAGSIGLALRPDVDATLARAAPPGHATTSPSSCAWMPAATGTRCAAPTDSPAARGCAWRRCSRWTVRRRAAPAIPGPRAGRSGCRGSRPVDEPGPWPRPAPPAGCRVSPGPRPSARSWKMRSSIVRRCVRHPQAGRAHREHLRAHVDARGRLDERQRAVAQLEPRALGQVHDPPARPARRRRRGQVRHARPRPSPRAPRWRSAAVRRARRPAARPRSACP